MSENVGEHLPTGRRGAMVLAICTACGMDWATVRDTPAMYCPNCYSRELAWKGEAEAREWMERALSVRAAKGTQVRRESMRVKTRGTTWRQRKMERDAMAKER